MKNRNFMRHEKLHNGARRGWLHSRSVGDCLRHWHALYHAHAHMHDHAVFMHVRLHQRFVSVDPLLT